MAPDDMPTPNELRIAELEGALKHILWIKDCGCDSVVDGKLLNHADAERDAMYDIAKKALDDSAHS